MAKFVVEDVDQDLIEEPIESILSLLRPDLANDNFYLATEIPILIPESSKFVPETPIFVPEAIEMPEPFEDIIERIQQNIINDFLDRQERIIGEALNLFFAGIRRRLVRRLRNPRN